MRGQLLLTNRLTIGALMKDLDSTAATAGGGVFATYDAANQRLIVTYQGIPATGTTAPNTLQVVIHASGEIDITIGALASTGPNYAPGILGTLGIASGQTRAVDFPKARPIDFGALKNGPPVILPFAGGGAIYAQYDQGEWAAPARPITISVGNGLGADVLRRRPGLGNMFKSTAPAAPTPRKFGPRRRNPRDAGPLLH
jgi:hypothetical protein